MHIPISMSIHWSYGIIHNFKRLPFAKVVLSGPKILLFSRCFANGILFHQIYEQGVYLMAFYNGIVRHLCIC